MSVRSLLADTGLRARSLLPLKVQDVLQLNRRKFDAKARHGDDRIVVAMGRDRQVADKSWFRGEHTNFNPTKLNLLEPDAVRDYVLKGWVPDAPFIDRSAKITTFGSCFAANVTRHLRQAGYAVLGDGPEFGRSYVVRYGEGMANSFAVAQQFEWAFGEREFDEALWFDKGVSEVGYDESVRAATRAMFLATDVFIVTLGLSEVWHHKQSGDVFWRAIPERLYDPRRHGFKVSTVAENRANLETILRLVRTHRRDASLIFTLSPVPLVATFRPVACITADSVSKAVLRVAVDELMRAHEDDERLFYFPSYEIVKAYARDPYKSDNRHIRDEVVSLIMDNFSRHFLLA